MGIIHWDWITLWFYMFIGVIIASLSWKAKRKSYINESGNKARSYKEQNKPIKINIYYLVLFLFLVFFAAFRHVEYLIGGYDAYGYVINFLNAKIFDINFKDIITLTADEPLYVALVYMVRLFTDNYHILFLVIYGIISYSYVKFISENYDRNASALPLMIITLPYIHSFNIIRNSLAIAIGLIALNNLKNNKNIKFITIVLISFFIHYTSVILIVFFVFYKMLFKERKIKKAKIILLMITAMVAIIILLPKIRLILLNTGYRGYVDPNYSLMGYLPIIILGALSLYNFKELNNRMNNNNQIHLYCVYFNCIILPVIIYLGGTRLSFYFLFSRIIVWSELIGLYRDKYGKNNYAGKILVQMVSVICIISWIIFRISKTWYSYGLMPYVNEFFRY